jgi:hypothetical protein
MGRSSKHVLQDLIAQGRLALTPGLRTECDLLMALPEFSLFEEMLKLRLDGEVPACCEREPDLKRAARAMIERMSPALRAMFDRCFALPPIGTSVEVFSRTSRRWHQGQVTEATSCNAYADSQSGSLNPPHWMRDGDQSDRTARLDRRRLALKLQDKAKNLA